MDKVAVVTMSSAVGSSAISVVVTTVTTTSSLTTKVSPAITETTRRRFTPIKLIGLGGLEHQNFCCGHWFPSQKSYQRHLAEKATQDADHERKLVELGLMKCPHCTLWVLSESMNGHLKKVHGIVKVSSKASKVVSNATSKEDSAPAEEIKKTGTSFVIKVSGQSAVKASPVELKKANITTVAKSGGVKLINTTSGSLYQSLKIQSSGSSSGTGKVIVHKSLPPHTMSMPIVSLGPRIVVKSGVTSLGSGLPKTSIGKLVSIPKLGNPVSGTGKSLNGVTTLQVAGKKKLSTSSSSEQNLGASTPSGGSTKSGGVQKSKVTKKNTKSKSKAVESTSVKSAAEANLSIRSPTGEKGEKIVSGESSSTKISENKKEANSANPLQKGNEKSISKVESTPKSSHSKKKRKQVLQPNVEGDKVPEQAPPLQAKVKKKSRPPTKESNGSKEGPTTKPSVNHKRYRRKMKENDNENFTPRSRQSNSQNAKRKRKRGPGRPRKENLPETPDLSELDSLFDEGISQDAENEPIMNMKKEEENVPTVELDLFTLPSLNEQMSVLLTEPKNPNFKVYASMDAIFVGDSALGDVTNQIGYVTDSNNVVYVSPSHFLFPNVEDLENFVPSPILTMKGTKLSLPSRQINKLISNKPLTTVVLKEKNISLSGSKESSNIGKIPEKLYSENRDSQKSTLLGKQNKVLTSILDGITADAALRLKKKSLPEKQIKEPVFDRLGSDHALNVVKPYPFTKFDSNQGDEKNPKVLCAERSNVSVNSSESSFHSKATASTLNLSSSEKLRRLQQSALDDTEKRDIKKVTNPSFDTAQVSGEGPLSAFNSGSCKNRPDSVDPEKTRSGSWDASVVESSKESGKMDALATSPLKVITKVATVSQKESHSSHHKTVFLAKALIPKGYRIQKEVPSKRSSDGVESPGRYLRLSAKQVNELTRKVVVKQDPDSSFGNGANTVQELKPLERHESPIGEHSPLDSAKDEAVANKVDDIRKSELATKEQNVAKEDMHKVELPAKLPAHDRELDVMYKTTFAAKQEEWINRNVVLYKTDFAAKQKEVVSRDFFINQTEFAAKGKQITNKDVNRTEFAAKQKRMHTKEMVVCKAEVIAEGRELAKKDVNITKFAAKQKQKDLSTKGLVVYQAELAAEGKELANKDVNRTEFAAKHKESANKGIIVHKAELTAEGKELANKDVNAAKYKETTSKGIDVHKAELEAEGKELVKKDVQNKTVFTGKQKAVNKGMVEHKVELTMEDKELASKDVIKTEFAATQKETIDKGIAVRNVEVASNDTEVTSQDNVQHRAELGVEGKDLTNKNVAKITKFSAKHKEQANKGFVVHKAELVAECKQIADKDVSETGFVAKQKEVASRTIVAYKGELAPEDEVASSNIIQDKAEPVVFAAKQIEAAYKDIFVHKAEFAAEDKKVADKDLGLHKAEHAADGSEMASKDKTGSAAKQEAVNTGFVLQKFELEARDKEVVDKDNIQHKAELVAEGKEMADKNVNKTNFSKQKEAADKETVVHKAELAAEDKEVADEDSALHKAELVVEGKETINKGPEKTPFTAKQEEAANKSIVVNEAEIVAEDKELADKDIDLCKTELAAESKEMASKNITTPDFAAKQNELADKGIGLRKVKHVAKGKEQRNINVCKAKDREVASKDAVVHKTELVLKEKENAEKDNVLRRTAPSISGSKAVCDDTKKPQMLSGDLKNKKQECSKNDTREEISCREEELDKRSALHSEAIKDSVVNKELNASLKIEESKCAMTPQKTTSSSASCIAASQSSSCIATSPNSSFVATSPSSSSCNTTSPNSSSFIATSPRSAVTSPSKFKLKRGNFSIKSPVRNEESCDPSEKKSQTHCSSSSAESKRELEYGKDITKDLAFPGTNLSQPKDEKFRNDCPSTSKNGSAYPKMSAAEARRDVSVLDPSKLTKETQEEEKSEMSRAKKSKSKTKDDDPTTDALSSCQIVFTDRKSLKTETLFKDKEQDLTHSEISGKVEGSKRENNSLGTLKIRKSSDCSDVSEKELELGTRNVEYGSIRCKDDDSKTRSQDGGSTMAVLAQVDKQALRENEPLSSQLQLKSIDSKIVVEKDFSRKSSISVNKDEILKASTSPSDTPLVRDANTKSQENSSVQIKQEETDPVELRENKPLASSKIGKKRGSHKRKSRTKLEDEKEDKIVLPEQDLNSSSSDKRKCTTKLSSKDTEDRKEQKSYEKSELPLERQRSSSAHSSVRLTRGSMKTEVLNKEVGPTKSELLGDKNKRKSTDQKSSVTDTNQESVSLESLEKVPVVTGLKEENTSTRRKSKSKPKVKTKDDCSVIPEHQSSLHSSNSNCNTPVLRGELKANEDAESSERTHKVEERLNPGALPLEVRSENVQKENVNEDLKADPVIKAEMVSLVPHETETSQENPVLDIRHETMVLESFSKIQQISKIREENSGKPKAEGVSEAAVSEMEEEEEKSSFPSIETDHSKGKPQDESLPRVEIKEPAESDQTSLDPQERPRQADVSVNEFEDSKKDYDDKSSMNVSSLSSIKKCKSSGKADSTDVALISDKDNEKDLEERDVKECIRSVVEKKENERKREKENTEQGSVVDDDVRLNSESKSKYIKKEDVADVSRFETTSMQKCSTPEPKKRGPGRPRKKRRKILETPKTEHPLPESTTGVTPDRRDEQIKIEMAEKIEPSSSEGRQPSSSLTESNTATNQNLELILLTKSVVGSVDDKDVNNKSNTSAKVSTNLKVDLCKSSEVKQDQSGNTDNSAETSAKGSELSPSREWLGRGAKLKAQVLIQDQQTGVLDSHVPPSSPNKSSLSCAIVPVSPEVRKSVSPVKEKVISPPKVSSPPAESANISKSPLSPKVSKSRTPSEDRQWQARGAKLKAQVMISDQQSGVSNSRINDALPNAPSSDVTSPVVKKIKFDGSPSSNKDRVKVDSPSSSNKDRLKFDSPSCSNKDKIKVDSPSSSNKDRLKFDNPFCSNKDKIEVDSSPSSKRDKTKLDSPSCSKGDKNPLNSSRDRIKSDSPLCSNRDKSKLDSPQSSNRDRTKYDSPSCSNGGKIKLETPSCSSRDKDEFDSPSCSNEDKIKSDSPPSSSKDIIKFDSPSCSNVDKVNFDSPPFCNRDKDEFATPSCSSKDKIKIESPPCSKKNKFDSPPCSNVDENKFDSPTNSKGDSIKFDSPSCSHSNRKKYDSPTSSKRDRKKLDSPSCSKSDKIKFESPPGTSRDIRSFFIQKSEISVPEQKSPLHESPDSVRTTPVAKKKKVKRKSDATTDIRPFLFPTAKRKHDFSPHGESKCIKLDDSSMTSPNTSTETEDPKVNPAVSTSTAQVTILPTRPVKCENEISHIKVTSPAKEQRAKTETQPSKSKECETSQVLENIGDIGGLPDLDTNISDVSDKDENKDTSTSIRNLDTIDSMPSMSATAMKKQNADTMEGMPSVSATAVIKQDTDAMDSMPSVSATAVKRQNTDAIDSMPSVSATAVKKQDTDAMDSMPNVSATAVKNQSTDAIDSMPSVSATAVKKQDTDAMDSMPSVSATAVKNQSTDDIDSIPSVSATAVKKQNSDAKDSMPSVSARAVKKQNTNDTDSMESMSATASKKQNTSESSEHFSEFEGFERGSRQSVIRAKSLLRLAEALGSKEWNHVDKFPLPVDQLCDWNDITLTKRIFNSN